MTTPVWAAAEPSDFPEVTFEVGHSLFRIHRGVHDPLYFSASDSGRWDPPVFARTEYGTCYLAESVLGAYLEVFARTVPIRESQINERLVSEIQVTRSLRLADLTSAALAGRVGPIPELSVGPSYTEAQQLSARLRDAGFDGVRYHARHDPTAGSRSIAVFSDAAASLGLTKTMPIPDHVIATGEQEFELFVLPDSPLY